MKGHSLGWALLILLITATLGRGATSNTQITVPLKCGGLGYDATTGVFYATARTNSGAFTNCLLRIAPLSGAVTVVTNLGSEPGTLTVSSEHRALYIAMPKEQAVRRFDLVSGRLAPAFPVGGAAKQLVVIPGSPERLVLIRKENLSLGLYENGTALPVPTFSGGYVSLMCSGADGSRLYGYNLNTTAYPFYRFGVDGSGISLLDESEGVFPRPGASMRFAGGRLYAGQGWIADPETKTLAGYFEEGGERSGVFPLGQVVPDLDRNRVFMLRVGRPESPIFACDPKSFRVINSSVVSNTTWSGEIAAEEEHVHDFQRWGADGFACRTYDKVLISRSTLVPSGTPRDLAMGLRATANVVTNKQVFSYVITCTNLGPLAATNALLDLELPPQTTYVSATTTHGTLSHSTNTVKCRISRLARNVGVSIRVSVRVQTTNVAALVARAAFSSPALDPNEDNNFGVLLTTANWRKGEEQYNVINSIAPTDMTYAGTTKRLYFLFGRSSGALAQTLAGLDPVSGVFDRPVFVPNDPQKLAVSPDGNWLDITLAKVAILAG
jgi:uncharacterized repeat protein (TIGR01451 family)